MIAISFVHPAMLGGLALASLPIIIHLLNRRRFKTMEWAAMEFLLKAAVRNRRRVRLENLLLLLLRTALVLLLITAVARPYSREQDALASLLGASGPTEIVLVLDDSHSMRAGAGNEPAFHAAKARAKQVVEELAKSGDRLTLMLGSRPRDAEEGFRRVTVAGAHGTRLARAIDALKPSDGTFDVVGAVDAILADRDEDETRLEVEIISDMRRRDWADGSGQIRPDVAKALAALGKRAKVVFCDVGSIPSRSNLGVVSLEPVDRAVIAGVPATFVARVRNYGPETVSNVTVQFEFGEHKQLPVRIEGEIRPGQDPVEVKTEFTFRTAGPAVVRALTPADLLPGDDVRRRIVSVRPRLRFLLVDGEPEPEAYRGETDFLAAALMPPGDVQSGIEVDVVPESTFPGRDPEAYDGIFLCNVYRVPDDRVKALEEYVRAGGGLVFFLGDQIDPQVYDAVFYGRGEEAGQKLLPLALREVEGSSDDYTNLAASAADHAAVRFLRGLHPVIFRTIAVNRFVKCDLPRGGAHVLLTYTDEDGSPALAEKAFGDGRVLLFTTAADLEWSNLPHSVLFVPLLQEAARYVVRRDPDVFTKTVGEPIVVRYDPKEMAPLVVVVPPPELGGAPVQLASARDDATKQLFYRYDRTIVAGEYAARLKTPLGEPLQRLYAMNIDASEGDLERVDLEKVREATPGSRIVRGGDGGALGGDDEDRSEFWRTLIVALVAVAALETVLAWRFGHHAAKRVEAEGKQVFVR